MGHGLGHGKTKVQSLQLPLGHSEQGAPLLTSGPPPENGGHKNQLASSVRQPTCEGASGWGCSAKGLGLGIYILRLLQPLSLICH